MSCITTSSIQVLINSRTTDAFYPSRGIRQGDPMSPYIFIMYMERLSRTIQQAVKSNSWNPIKISTQGPSLSHLIFADDLILFAKVDAKNCNTIANILNNFRVELYQNVNCSKSRILFSKNCKTATRTLCTSILSIEEKYSFGKYLGFPIFNKRFQFLVDNMRQRLTGWNHTP